MLGIWKQMPVPSPQEQTAYISGSRVQQGESLSAKSQILGCGCDLLHKARDKGLWFANLFPALMGWSHFPTLFCSCAGNQIAFIILNSVQKTVLPGDSAYKDKSRELCFQIFYFFFQGLGREILNKQPIINSFVSSFFRCHSAIAK